MFKRLKRLLLVLSWMAIQSATAAPALPYFQQQDKTFALSQLSGRLQGAEVILIGEEHSRYGQHLTQLAIIKTLAASGRPLTIAMEYFQQPFQQALDDFIAGKATEAQMLRTTEYFTRWRYDYRLYQPILRYARAQQIPLLALNVTAELTTAVSHNGFDGLTASYKVQLPNRAAREDTEYVTRLRPIYEQHRQQGQGNNLTFAHFVQAQVLWDEGMAEHAANYLKAHPNRLLVILAGAQHVINKAIPDRLQRRLTVRISTLQPASAGNQDKPQLRYYPLTNTLPTAGLLGVMLDLNMGLEISGFSATSAAPKAGVKKGDRIVAINHQKVVDYAGLKLALMNQQPGQMVTLKVLHPDQTSAIAQFKLH